MDKYKDPIVLLSYCGLIFYLSSQPNIPLDGLFSFQDKVMHLAAYGVMAFFAWRAFGHIVRNRSRLSWCCAAFCMLYGLSDEFHQSYVPGRMADPYDWIADAAGATIAVLLIRVIKPATVLQFSRNARFPE